MKRFLPLLYGGALVLSACDPMSQLTYKVRNDAGTPVAIVATNFNKTDTFRVPGGETVTIAVNNQGITSVDNCLETGTYLRDLTAVSAYKDNMTTASHTDLRLTSRWSYRELKRDLGEYTLTVSPTDFP